MTAVADRYRRLARQFTEVVAAVPDDAWERPSPCEGWAARDVVGHVAESTGIFFGLVGRPAPVHPDAAADPMGAWTATRDAVLAALEDPEVAAAEYDGRLGRSDFQTSVDRFLSFDLIVHAWDLATAVGLDHRMPDDEVAALLGQMPALSDMMAANGVIKAALPVDDDADDQTKLLAYLGRAA